MNSKSKTYTLILTPYQPLSNYCARSQYIYNLTHINPISTANPPTPEIYTKDQFFRDLAKVLVSDTEYNSQKALEKEAPPTPFIYPKSNILDKIIKVPRDILFQKTQKARKVSRETKE